MSTLLDVAIDLINEAKSTKDAQAKLYQLEQVKEICLHRQKSALKDIIPSMLDFMVEKAASVKKFLIKFCEEAMNQDCQLAFPYFLNMANFLIADSNDTVLAALARCFARFYDAILLKIAEMPVIAKAQGLSDPKQLWQMFTAISNKFSDFIATKRSDQLKVNCLRLLENQMIFNLPNASAVATAAAAGPVRKDPRLARAQAASAAAARTTADGATKSADDIPLHHAIISRNELQSAAEDAFTRVLLWSGKGGPQGHPFSPSIMAVLGQVIANVAAARLKNASTAAKALVAMLQSKGSATAEMTGGDRGNLARAVHRLLRAATAYGADPEGMIPKLRSAVAALEALGLDVGTDASSAAAGARKRDVDGNPRDSSAAGDEDPEAAQLRSSAVAAVDAAERKLSSSQGAGAFAGLEGLGFGGTDDDDAIAMLLAEVSSSSKAAQVPAAGGKPTASSSGGSGFVGMLISGDTTELAKDLASADDLKHAAGLKLVSTAAAGAASSVEQVPIAPSEQGYADLALCTLHKLLEGFHSVEQTNIQMLAPYTLMCVKAVVSMACVDLQARRAAVPVQIVSIIPTTLAGKLSSEVPTQTLLPRPLWMFLGFVLGEHATAPTEGVSAEETNEDLQRKVAMLTRLCRALYEEIQWRLEAREEALQRGDPAVEGDIADTLQAAYNALCITTISRMMQLAPLRPSLSAFMLGLPSIPSGALAVLKLLVTTGSKGPSEKGREKVTAASGRGTRIEALSLLGQAVFSQDETASREALMYLLKLCIAEDFELRSRVINLLVSEVVHIEDWCDEIVLRFSVQALIGAVGPEAVKAWLAGRSSRTRAEDEDAVMADPEEMEVNDGGGDETHDADLRAVSLAPAAEEYFEDEEVRAQFPAVGAADREAYSKRVVQLLSQLCVVHPQLLVAIPQVYSAWMASGGGKEDEGAVSEEGGAAAAETGDEAEDGGIAAGEDQREPGGEGGDGEEAEGQVVPPAAPGKPAVAWTLAETLKGELRNILPAIAQGHTAERIFDILTSGADSSTRPLLAYALGVLLYDMTVPPTQGLIEKVKAFAARQREERRLEGGDQVGGDDTATGAEESKGDTEMEVDNEASNPSQLDIPDVEDFKLMLPLLGGLSEEIVERWLPRIIGLYAEQPGELKVHLDRITKARPPPMTKAALLVALHRLDFETHGLKAKSVLDAISVCLNNKADYSGEVVKEALRTMLADEVPPHALMRTAILSAQSFSEVKRFVLSDVMPQLVRKRVWVTAPKLWDGVVYGAKNLAAAGFKNSELTLRALLGVPVAQLKNLLRVAPTVKAAMGKLLKTLSTEERDEAVSGKWAGLTEEADATSLEEKQKLIKDIAASVSL